MIPTATAHWVKKNAGRGTATNEIDEEDEPDADGRTQLTTNECTKLVQKYDMDGTETLDFGEFKDICKSKTKWGWCAKAKKDLGRTEIIVVESGESTARYDGLRERSLYRENDVNGSMVTLFDV